MKQAKRFLVLILLVSAIDVQPAFGTYWQGPPGTPGDWHDANNWTDGLPAGNSNTATIDNGGIAVFNEAYSSCGNVFVGETFGGTLIQNSARLSVYSMFLVGKGAGPGRYEMHGGELKTADLQVGRGSPSEVIQTGGNVQGQYHYGVTLNVLTHGSYRISGADSRLRADRILLQNRGGNGGRFIQDGGNVSVEENLSIGASSLEGNRSQYDLNAGQLTTHVSVLDLIGDNVMRQAGGKHQTNRLVIRETARYEYGGGELAVSGEVRQDGTLVVSGIGQGIGIGTYQQSVTGLLISEIDSNGLTPIEVTGPAMLDGNWVVTDHGAGLGRWTVLTAYGYILGEFDAVDLPNDDWSWGIEGGKTLWVERVPEPATLSLLALGGLVLVGRRKRRALTLREGPWIWTSSRQDYMESRR